MDASAIIDDFSVEHLRKTTVVNLKTLLRNHNELVSGNKEMLVARCLALKSRLEAQRAKEAASASDDDLSNAGDDNNNTMFNPFADFELCREITYYILNGSAKNNEWSDDLRTLIEVNFHQLYEYLVIRTQKFEGSVMKGSTYKKLKSYLYFVEGHISNVEITRGYGHVWVRAKVTASMKKIKYKVIVVFDEEGDVKYAACECPAGYVYILGSVLS